MRTFRDTLLVDSLSLAIIGAFLAMYILPHFSIILPQFTHTESTMDERRLTMLQTIRGQIELYNTHYPDSAYDEATPTGPGFWDRLVDGDYLQCAPKNDLQHGSSLVVGTPRRGAGWVWTDLAPGAPSTFDVYWIDEKGKLYDGDGDGEPD